MTRIISFEELLRAASQAGDTAEWHDEDDARAYVGEAQQALEWLGFGVILEDQPWNDGPGLQLPDIHNIPMSMNLYIHRCLEIVRISGEILEPFGHDVDYSEWDGKGLYVEHLGDEPLFQAGLQYFLTLIQPYGDDTAYDYHTTFMIDILEWVEHIINR